MPIQKLLFPLLAAGLALAAPGLSAEEHDEPQDDSPVASERFLERLDEKLKLNDKQRAKIKGILDGSRSELKARQEKLKSLREQMRAVQKQLQEKTRDVNERIRQELDNEQRERFDEMRSRMRRGGQRRRFPGPMEEGTEDAPEPMRRRRERRQDKIRDDNMPPPEMWHDRGPGQGGGPRDPKPEEPAD